MEKRKQHYVPQFYLRNFSCNSDQKTVGVFVLDSGTFRGSVPIRDQAYEKYLYGKESKIEDELGKVEGRAAEVIRRILETSALPPGSSEDQSVLLTFSILQHERTMAAADALDEVTDKSMKAVFSDDPRVKDHLDEVKIGLREPALAALAGAAKNLPVAFDLEWKLLENKSPRRLLTSDNPAIFYNQFLEKRKPYGSNTGLACKGLQIFLPISPKHLLVFYDRDVYGVGSQSRNVVQTESHDDIARLNVLQALSARECLYFDHTFAKEDLDGLMRRANGFKRLEKARVEKFYAPPDGDGKRRSLVWMHKTDIRCDLQLSFNRILKKAKCYDLGSRAVHLRNPALSEAHERSLGLDRRPPTSMDKPAVYLRDKPPGWDGVASPKADSPGPEAKS